MKEYQVQTDQYNVIYKALGKSDRSSMPLGNGKVGISLWVEEDGDLQFYIGHTDAQSEVDRNLKLGKVILKLNHNPFIKGADFRQELVLREGCVNIYAGSNGNTVHVKVFVDALSDCIYVDINSSNPLNASAQLFCWRTAEKAPWKIPDLESVSGGFIKEAADKVYDKENGIVFYHKNGITCVKSTAMIEAVSEYMDQLNDTLNNRTFGGFLTLENSIVQGNGVLISNGAKNHHLLKISIFCDQEADTTELIDRVTATHKHMPEVADAAKRTAQYWDKYFGQSYIFVGGDKEATTVVPEEIRNICREYQDNLPTPSNVTRSYILTKYMFACSGKGRIPIHFNGMIFNLMPGLKRHLGFDGYCETFTAQPEGQPGLEINPDEKGWEECINLWQNVRLPYAAMLERGEFESVKLLFDYYRSFWNINKVRAKVYYNAGGQYNTEMTNSFGLLPVTIYGTNRTGVPDGYAQNRWGGAIDISPGLELCFMMLDYFDYTRDVCFLNTELLPYTKDLLHYIETRFHERKCRKIVLKKLQCVETYFDTTDPITVISGMHSVTNRILSLPHKFVKDRAFYEKFNEMIPPMPIEKDEDGNAILAPARVYEDKRMNVESPVLYPVYPFRMFTHYKGDLALIKRTFEYNNKVLGCFRPYHFGNSISTASYSGWQYMGMVTALLGMVDESKEILENNCALKNPGCRFPAMWGPIYDAVPDCDHGANITNILQLMAMQSDGDEIHILPAWPNDWDVNFRLFAGNNTIVECEYKNGKIRKLDVSHEERRKDVKIRKTILCGMKKY
jgi:hypothetical protein